MLMAMTRSSAVIRWADHLLSVRQVAIRSMTSGGVAFRLA